MDWFDYIHLWIGCLWIRHSQRLTKEDVCFRHRDQSIGKHNSRIVEIFSAGENARKVQDHGVDSVWIDFISGFVGNHAAPPSMPKRSSARFRFAWMHLPSQNIS